MIQFTAQPDHFSFPDTSCFACRWMQAHRNLREWVETRGVLWDYVRIIGYGC